MKHKCFMLQNKKMGKEVESMLSSISLNKERILTAILGVVAAAAVLFAQTSSYSCWLWSYEQPKMPKSLIK